MEMHEVETGTATMGPRFFVNVMREKRPDIFATCRYLVIQSRSDDPFLQDKVDGTFCTDRSEADRLVADSKPGPFWPLNENAIYWLNESDNPIFLGRVVKPAHREDAMA
jgi:hypothetical protein